MLFPKSAKCCSVLKATGGSTVVEPLTQKRKIEGLNSVTGS